MRDPVPDTRRIAASTEFRFSERDFAAIAQIAYREAGLNLPKNKRSLVYSRLTRRLRELGLNDFATYVGLLESDRNGSELDHLLSSLTTNVTAFFREAHHFTHLREAVLPGLIDAARGGRRVRIWSAATSSGEEAYSVALCVLAACPEVAKFDFRILGTDINDRMINRARRAEFPLTSRKSFPDDLSHVLPPVAPATTTFTMPRTAREICRFNRLNLLGEWPFSGPFDVILCRNVAIYFDAETQARLWARLNEMLKDSGHLYIGHSERIAGPAEMHLRSTGITQYQKTPVGQ